MVENTGTGYTGTDIRVYGYTGIGYTGIRIYGYTDIRIYILLDVLVYNIAVYFYEFCSILTSPQGESKYKERVKMYSDIVHQNIS